MAVSIAGRGSKVQRSTDGDTYVTIAQVKTFTQSGSKQDYDEVTNMDSSNYREYVATLNTSGEMNFDLVFYPGDATQTQLRADWNDQTLLYWKVVLSNGTNGLSFQGFVESPGDIDATIDKSVVRKGAKLKITGPVTEF